MPAPSPARARQPSTRKHEASQNFLKPLTECTLWFCRTAGWRLSAASLRALPLLLLVGVAFPLCRLAHAMFGQFVVSGGGALGILALFARFDQLLGWTLAEVALFYATINVAMAIGGFTPSEQAVDRNRRSAEGHCVRSDCLRSGIGSCQGGHAISR